MKKEEKHQQFHLSDCFYYDPNCLLWKVGSYGGKEQSSKGLKKLRKKAQPMWNWRKALPFELKMSYSSSPCFQKAPKGYVIPKILQVRLILGSIPYPGTPKRPWFQRVVRCESGGVWEGLEASALTSIAGHLLIQTLISDRFESIGHVLNATLLISNIRLYKQPVPTVKGLSRGRIGLEISRTSTNLAMRRHLIN